MIANRFLSTALLAGAMAACAPTSSVPPPATAATAATAVTPATPQSPVVQTNRALRFFEWRDASGPCPPGNQCLTLLTVDAAGVMTYLDGPTTTKAQLSPSDLANLGQRLGTPEVVAQLRAFHPCDGPTDHFEGVTIQMADEPPAKATLRTASDRPSVCNRALYDTVVKEVRELTDRYTALRSGSR